MKLPYITYIEKPCDNHYLIHGTFGCCMFYKYDQEYHVLHDGNDYKVTPQWLQSSPLLPLISVLTGHHIDSFDIDDVFHQIVKHYLQSPPRINEPFILRNEVHIEAMHGLVQGQRKTLYILSYGLRIAITFDRDDILLDVEKTQKVKGALWKTMICATKNIVYRLEHMKDLLFVSMDIENIEFLVHHACQDWQNYLHKKHEYFTYLEYGNNLWDSYQEMCPYEEINIFLE